MIQNAIIITSFWSFLASFGSHLGGIFVARTDNTKRNIIIGTVVAILVIAVLVLGISIYCKRNPNSWQETKKGFNAVKFSSKSRV